MSWEDDLAQSRRAFVDLVAPVIEDWTGGEVQNIESVTESSVSKQLDQLAGIDAWDIVTDDGIRGVASRCQPMYPFDTFTVRKYRASQEGTDHETEFEKRRRQINNDLLYPHYTVQAYYDADAWILESAAMTKTKDLIKFIENGTEGDESTWYGDGFGEGDYWTKAVGGGSESMYCVDWDYLRDRTTVGLRVIRPHQDPDEKVSPNSQSSLEEFGGGEHA